jgi:hypothetical protein
MPGQLLDKDSLTARALEAPGFQTRPTLPVSDGQIADHLGLPDFMDGCAGLVTLRAQSQFKRWLDEYIDAILSDELVVNALTLERFKSSVKTE